MNKANMTRTCVAALALVLTGCSGKPQYTPTQQAGPNPPLPAPRNYLVPPMQVPRFTGWKQGERPAVAAGLKIEKIASSLMHPRQLVTLPNGDVLVVEANGPDTEPITTLKQWIAGKIKNLSGKGGKGGNRITLLQKTPNGQWEKHVFLEHLHSPFGVQLIGDTLYVANTGDIMKYHYVTGETHISDPGTELADLPDTINHHWTKSLLASPDGKELFVGVGSNSNASENGLAVEYRRADILEVYVDTGASRIYAAGLRNPTGLQWQPVTGKLWAIVMGRDEIGADLVPDYLTSVQEGGFYGWPYSYWGQHVDERVQPQRPDLVAKTIKPDYSLGSHIAPLGLWFYVGHNLPENYRGGAFISEHGSWDRSPLSGYQVVFVRFQDGQPVGAPEPVVTGFVAENEKSLMGAPVGLTEDADGALLIADDVGNCVWRVTAEGTGGGVATPTD